MVSVERRAELIDGHLVLYWSIYQPMSIQQGGRLAPPAVLFRCGVFKTDIRSSKNHPD
jgi:hypothetical protein